MTEGAGYNTGFEGVTEALKKAKQNSGGAASRHFSWKDGDKKLVRFLDDQVITIGFHSYVTCLDGKGRDFICSNELAGDLKRPCWICANVTYVDKRDGDKVKNVRPWTQTIGLAVFRKEVPKSSGKGTTIVDGTHEKPLELEVDGVTKKYKDVPWVGIIKQSVGNFWANVNPYYARYGTTMDRDYEITRTGSAGGAGGTRYAVISVDVDEKLRVKDDDGDTDIIATKKLVLETYASALLFHPNLIEYIERMGSEAYYDAHLTGKGRKVEAATEDTAEVASEEVAEAQKDDSSVEAPEGGDDGDSTEFGSLREKLMGYSSK